MFTKSSPREESFAPPTSRNTRIAVTLRLQMARDEKERREMGARIEELRASRGFKQQYIADRVGVQLRTYQLWQAGAITPGQENLEKLAEVFCVTPQFILRGETPDLSLPEDQLSQLDRIEAKLDAIQAETQKRYDTLDRLIRQREDAERRIRHMSAEEADEMIRLLQEARARQGRDVGLRSLPASVAKGRPRRS